jgi:long-chain fatty acid transport protein
MKRYVFSTVALLLASVAFATHGTRMVGFDAKTVGRGGTNIGIFDNTSLMMTNPAGIAFLDGSTLDANFSLMVPHTHFSNSLNDQKGETNYFPLPGLSYVSHSTTSNLAWGVGLFTQGGMGSDFTLNHNLFRTQTGEFIPQEYHSKLGVMQGGPSVAYKFNEKFSVGVSAHLVFSQLEFKMPYSLAPSIMKGVINPQTGMTFGDMFAAPPAQGGFGYTEVTAAANMNDLTAFGFGGKLGFAYKVNDQLSLGAGYSSPSKLTYKSGKATMDMTAQLNDAFGKAVQGYMAQNPGATQQQAQGAVMQQFTQLGIDLSKGVVAQYDLETKLTLPQTLGFGASVKAANNLRIAADVEWVNWKNAFDKMSLALSNGNNSNINRMLGISGSFGIDFPMEWKDALTFNIGGEYDVNADLTLRAGYAYGGNPVPETTIFPVFPAIVENHLMLGGSYQLSRPLVVHAAYELALNKKENASGQSMVAQEFNNSTSELAENIFHVSLTWVIE